MSREQGREQGQGGNKETLNREFSIFVENLPQNLDKYGLKGIFSRAGKVSDVYIPFRVGRRSGRRFGFVRFWRRADAIRSIRLFNNHTIRGRRINVCEAKFGKGRQSSRNNTQPTQNYEQRAKKVWRKRVCPSSEKKEAIVVHLSQEDSFNTKHLKGEISGENLDWLRRSLVCSTDTPRDLGALVAAMNIDFPLCTKVSALSKFKFLLTFQSVQELEDALEKPTELEQWFSCIKKWDIYDTSDTRRTWIEVFGIPPHGWTWENFKRIAEVWGSFVCLDSSIDNPESFESMKVLIDTDHFNNIDGGLVLDLEDCGYRVKVREVQYIYKNTAQNLGQKTKSVDFWPGFEDVSSDEQPEKTIDEGNHEGAMIQDVSNLRNCNQEGDFGEPLGFQISNTQEDEQVRVYSGVASSSRTESAVFFGNSNRLRELRSAINGQTLNLGSPDSEATIENSQPTLPTLNDNHNDNYQVSSPEISLELGCSDSHFFPNEEFQVSPRRKLKSKAKKKKLIKEKCMQIQKKIKKKTLKKSLRQTQKKEIVYDSFIEEARHVWETSKAVGLATKGQDEEVVVKIAMNLAEEAEEREARNQE